MLRPRLILILIASTIFTAAICAFVFWMLAKGEESASKASTQFATALVKNDPSLAPKGGADYLEGLRSQFGEVSDARVIETRNHHVGSGDDGRTYYVSDLLLQTARGAAVVQLEFDSMQLISDTVTNVRELEPREIKGLDDADLTTVAKAFVARGDEAEAGFDSSTVGRGAGEADRRAAARGQAEAGRRLARDPQGQAAAALRPARQGRRREAGTLRGVTYTKYPRTWHLPDSPNRGADGDHAHADYSTFEGREVVVTEKLDGENTTIYADGYTPRAFGLQRLSPDAHLGAGARRPRRVRASRRLADLRREHLRAALDRLRPAAVVLPAVRGLRRPRTPA